MRQRSYQPRLSSIEARRQEREGERGRERRREEERRTLRKYWNMLREGERAEGQLDSAHDEHDERKSTH